MGRFQAIDADAVVSIAVVEYERLLAVRQYLVGSLVRRCEGWTVAVAAHKDVGAVCQSGGLIECGDHVVIFRHVRCDIFQRELGLRLL